MLCEQQFLCEMSFNRTDFGIMEGWVDVLIFFNDSPIENEAEAVTI